MTKANISLGSVVLSPEMKIYELIDAAPMLLSLFSRLNIHLPFGDISVAEMCRRDGYNPQLFIMLCAMHIDLRHRPADEDITPDMLPEVIAYLRASHRYYAERMLPHTALHLEEILSYCDNLSERVLRGFYDDYTHYIKRHFEEEEREIFTLMERGERDANFALFDMPHADIDDRSNDIASLIVKSLPEAAPTPLRCAMLKDVYELRDDLRRHSNIETYLLRPLVEKYIKRQ
jgi:regulator of cell morphogenesis and NO signaling